MNTSTHSRIVATNTSLEQCSKPTEICTDRDAKNVPVSSDGPPSPSTPDDLPAPSSVAPESLIAALSLSSDARQLIDSHNWRLEFLRRRALSNLSHIEAMEVIKVEAAEAFPYLMAIRADADLDAALVAHQGKEQVR